MEKEMQDDETITVSKVYETLKSGPFLKKLYWDVLSDIKEKDTFKQMRNTTEQLLNKKTEDLVNLSDSESDNLQRKTIVAQICSMTYAIDTVYSRILFLKLQKEFKSQIIDAIKDLRREKRIPDSVWSKLQISDDPEVQDAAENSTAKSNSSQQRPEISSRPVRIKRQKMSSIELATKNKELRSEIHEDLKAINSEDGKVVVSRKKRKVQNRVCKKVIAPSVKSTSKKKEAEENQIPSELNTLTENPEDRIILKEEMQIEYPESDAESEISVGNVSLTSVSSVHTSDLSSFDDEISLSSEDGDNGTKKRLSLKDLKEICSNGRLSNTFNGSLLKNLPEKSSEKAAVANNGKNEQSSPDNADSVQDSADSSTEGKSPSQKTFPKRVRKPNSKYSSENILCTITKVKKRKKQPVEVGNSVKNNNNVNNSNDVKTFSDATQPSGKRGSASDSDGDVPFKILKTVSVKEEDESESYSGSPPKQSRSPELYKSQVTIRSLTSRKTAPVTLYST